jgi:hypothetical protein
MTELSGIAAAIWLADKASGGLVSEYIKRFWFKRIHVVQDTLGQLKEELHNSIDRYDSISNRVDEILQENERLQKEVIRLRVENGQLLKDRPETNLLVIARSPPRGMHSPPRPSAKESMSPPPHPSAKEK